MSTPRVWELPEVVSWGTLPMSSLRHEGADDGVEREELDGRWAFELFATPDAALGRAAAGTPLRAELPVPGCWTTEPFDDVDGVRDRPQYTNVQMPWPGLLPGELPGRNPTGVYERTVRVPQEWAGRRVVLHVGAAESVLLVAVDGVELAAGTDSHLATEVDLTGVVRPGTEHVLRLTVVKWSAASWVEDQDQWWHGGITRPVFLYTTPLVHLADVRIRAGLAGELPPAGLLEGDTHPGELTVDVEVARAHGADEPEALRVEVDLDGARLLTGGVPVAHPVDVPGARSASGDLTFTPRTMDLVHLAAAGAELTGDEDRLAAALRDVRRPAGLRHVRLHAGVGPVTAWSAETPELHEVVVRLVDAGGTTVQSARYRVGFRRVEVRGRDLLVNGVRVLVRGVNRHDVDPRGGRALPPGSERRDLELLKRNGFNAVRTSHYPNAPELLDAADELGLFVVDEADLETHAFAHAVADDPRYLAAFVTRVSRMVRRDVNHPSVTLWSLGNEAGYGTSHDAAAGWVRRYDPTRPVQYEGAIAWDWAGPQTASDVACPMYPPVEALVAHARSGRQRLPLIMCEYTHAMGNSNGGLADYWHAFTTEPGLQGGFVWELRDHGLLQRLADGAPVGLSAGEVPEATAPGVAPDGHRWAYGGDFGEDVHDGAFVTDGLLFPDRTPKPGFLEHRALTAPVTLTRTDDGRLEVGNAQDVLSLRGLTATWDVVAVRGPGDVSRRTAPADLPPLAAGGRAPLEVPAEILAALPPDAEVHATLRVRRGPHDVAEPQVPARPAPPAPPAPAARTVPGVEVGDDGSVVHPLLAAPPEVLLWRAPTDNDEIGGLAARWRELGLDRLASRVASVSRDGDRVVVVSVVTTATGIEVRHRRAYASLDGGGLLVEEQVELPAELDDVPRVGTLIEPVVPGDVQVRWYGRGPAETYPDRCAAGTVDVHTLPLAAMHTPYLRPQEAGGRAGVRWVQLLDDGAPAATLLLDAPRQVSVTPYRPEDLTAATHHDELRPRARPVVVVDAAHRGVGTASCGPDTPSRYRLRPGTFAWSYRLT